MDGINFTAQELQIGDDNYWAQFPPEVQALRAMPTDAGVNAPARFTAAYNLALKGYSLDTEIHALGFNATAEMWYRANVRNQPWFPNMLQPVIGVPTPGQNNPPYSPYDGSHPPVGAIMTVIPSVVAPAPPPPPTPGHELVGPVANVMGQYPSGPGVLISPAGVNVPDGVFVAPDRITIIPAAVPGGYVGKIYPILVGNWQVIFTKTP